MIRPRTMTHLIFLLGSILIFPHTALPKETWPPADLRLPSVRGNTEIDPTSPFLWVSRSGAWLETRSTTGLWTRTAVRGIHSQNTPRNKEAGTDRRTLLELHKHLSKLDQKFRQEAGVELGVGTHWQLNLVLDRQLGYSILHKIRHTAGLSRFHRLVVAVNDHRSSAVLLSSGKVDPQTSVPAKTPSLPLALDIRVSGGEIRIRGLAKNEDVRQMAFAACSSGPKNTFECRFGKHQISALSRLATILKTARPTENSFSISLDANAPIAELLAISDAVGRQPSPPFPSTVAQDSSQSGGGWLFPYFVVRPAE